MTLYLGSFFVGIISVCSYELTVMNMNLSSQTYDYMDMYLFSVLLYLLLPFKYVHDHRIPKLETKDVHVTKNENRILHNYWIKTKNVVE